ncbi:MAG: NAD+ synthase, partial [Deltaproteobacteria bacterium]|nr:NAD+ synthase [Deltaproteobacteria bacterium]
MRCAIIQNNPKVGDITGNCLKIESAARMAVAQGATLAVCQEMSIIGYPPRDLLQYNFLIEEANEAVAELAGRLADLDLTLIVGSVDFNPSIHGRSIQNVALILERGQITGRYAKRLLPTYDVFDEARYFEPGTAPLTFAHKGVKFALTICEDIWNDFSYFEKSLYPIDPLTNHPPFDVLLNLSASPFYVGKQRLREEMVGFLAKKYSVQAVYVNQAGADDELVFDGRSFHVDRNGKLINRAKAFEEDLLMIDFDQKAAATDAGFLSPQQEFWGALVLGVRDYCRKNGLGSVVLGLSGGIDSALTAAIAAEAVGPSNVTGILMPSPHSSDHSLNDALELIKNLSLRPAQILHIREVMESFDRTLAPVFQARPKDTTEENIQARIRGTLLMAVANKFGSILLTTGNKSEIAVGYCTIYGDMCGALAVIGDLYKTEVFKLAAWLNQTKGPTIPISTLTKPPSAELRPNQVDQDSLPPYDQLDEILKMLVEDRQGPAALELKGYSPELVRKVANLVRIAEFKRRQGAPVIKVTEQAFGVG